MIPLTATLRMRAGGGRVWKLWLPLFVVWLLLLPLALLLFPLLLIVGVFVGVSAFRLYRVVIGVLCSLRNTRVEVESEEAEFRLCLR